ncbi:MAG: hypothetical protein ACKVY0_27265 [Prosthecobacter sp.]|uniref:hypothetical protein n=1 Tax=Prosthecobacter sp. TaxID=1965333 RepID=UPI003900F4FA
MRLPCLFCLLILLTPPAQAQPATLTPPQLTCEALCAELAGAIRANPERLVMRLEEALVINEACAGELVTTAIDAVNADPALVRKIVETALEIAPGRTALITAAAANYSAPVVVVASDEAMRSLEAADAVKMKRLPGEEVRRAELPLVKRSIPIVEVRRAQLPAAARRVEQQPAAPFNLLSVPRAKPLGK